MTHEVTAIQCECSRCGYGSEGRKPWVVLTPPKRCKGCGSPYWNTPRKSYWPQDSSPVPDEVAKMLEDQEV